MSTISIVHSERPLVGKMQYDLGVYQDGKEFHATWFCVGCPARGKTVNATTQCKAYDDGMAALEAHVRERHAS